jgi:hypothetical protein
MPEAPEDAPKLPKARIFDEWLSEDEAAAAVGKSKRTLRKWRYQRIGPPYALFGKSIKYRGPALVEHYKQSEISPVRSLAKRGRPSSTP